MCSRSVVFLHDDNLRINYGIITQAIENRSSAGCTFLRRFNFQWKVTLNFSTLSRAGASSSFPPPEYRFEMTKAPLLSEEAQISLMIEEKRGTRDIIATRLLARDEGGDKKGEGVGDRSIPIGMHARRFLRVDTTKWQEPENRPMILCQEFQGKLIRFAFRRSRF